MYIILYLQINYDCDIFGEYTIFTGHLIMAIFVLYFAEATKKVRKPKPWKHPQSISVAQLRQLRDEFWDTAPHYGGQRGTSHFWILLMCLNIFASY
jgi:hypothetical protein